MAIGPTYNPYAQNSGTDPRGRLQNQGAYQQQRYESQQGPVVNQLGYQMGRANESDYGNMTDMMNMYRGIASGGNNAPGGGGSGGGSGGPGGGIKAHNYTAFTYNPAQTTASQAQLAADPYKSYEGFQDFSQNGGYSPADISNMRARGVSPIRAAYANAEREIGRQRSMQGGYTPNAIALQGRMAREQGQSAADATTNVEAGLAEARNRGRLSGLAGMSGIEGQRYSAGNDMNQFNAGQLNQVGMFNTGQMNQGNQYNMTAKTNAQGNTFASQDRAGAASASAAQSNANRRAQANQYGVQNQLEALQGMRGLYGTTPGASNMYGQQVINAMGQGATYGLGVRAQDRADQGMPGAFDQTMGRMGQVGGLIGQGLNVASNYFGTRNRNQQNNGPFSGSRPVQERMP